MIGGHKIDSLYLESYLSVIKRMSIRIFQTIAQKHHLKIIVEDTGNAFIYMSTNKKAHTLVEEEFEER